MKRIVLLTVLLLPMSGLAQLHRETIFGLDVPVYDWSRQADVQYFGGSPCQRMGIVEDVANVRFANGADSTDIILMLDSFIDRIYWVRAQANRYPRPLEHFGYFGELDGDSSYLFYPMSIAVASLEDIYNPQTDHIYVADYMNNRIVKLNFRYDPAAPANDAILWESAISLDADFHPCDLAYLDLRSGRVNDNRLVALDCYGERLVVVSHEGNILREISLANPLDSIPHMYTAFTWKANDDRSLSIYLLDTCQSKVRRFTLSRDGLEYQNEIALGQMGQSRLGDILWHRTLGLWVSDGEGPHFYKLADDLSSIFMEINQDDFNPRVIYEPYKVVVFPERLVIIQCTTENTGLISFSFGEPLPKPSEPVPASLPFEFSLSQNYPNPFNPSTTLEYSIAEAGWVKIEIFNILGQKVHVLLNDYQVPGRYKAVWNGRNQSGDEISSGLYFARLVSAHDSRVVKMTLLK